jgi:hypothetical protein
MESLVKNNAGSITLSLRAFRQPEAPSRSWRNGINRNRPLQEERIRHAAETERSREKGKKEASKDGGARLEEGIETEEMARHPKRWSGGGRRWLVAGALLGAFVQ